MTRVHHEPPDFSLCIPPMDLRSRFALCGVDADGPGLFHYHGRENMDSGAHELSRHIRGRRVSAIRCLLFNKMGLCHLFDFDTMALAS